MSTCERQVATAGVEPAARRLRRGLAAAACAAAALFMPAAASAHGGTRVVWREAGGFDIAVDALAIRSGDRVGAVDYTVTLKQSQDGTPVTDGRVQLTVEKPGGVTIGPLVTHRRLDTYAAVIPVSAGEGWESDRVTIAVSSPSTRTVVVAYRPPAPAFTWPWRQPFVLGGACLACALYARAFARLRRRGRRDLASAGRLAMFGAGVALGVLAVISPVDPIGERYLLSTHMLQHVAIGDATPALLVAGLRGPIGLFVLPRVALRTGARSARVRCAVSLLLNPAVALGLWAAVYAGWHVPAAYDAALASPVLHDLEHASFFVAGLVVWTVLIEPFPRCRLTSRARMGVAVMLLVLGNALSNTLLLSLHPLYAGYADQPVRLWGLSALTDQRLAGAVMMIEQLASLTLCMAFLVRSDRRAARDPRSVSVMT